MIEFLEQCPSTHLKMCEDVKNCIIKPPYAVCAKSQSSGVGSRGNCWEGYDGNLFLSFCLLEHHIPSDIEQASLSIYFSMIMKEYLKKQGSNLWVKWPNDFYIDEKKIGGTISTKIKETYIGSIGLNLLKAPKECDILDISIDANELVWGFCAELEKKISWKQIFSKFKIEFAKSKKFITHIGDKKVDISFAEICDDGAILLDNKKVYSLR